MFKTKLGRNIISMLLLNDTKSKLSPSMQIFFLDMTLAEYSKFPKGGEEGGEGGIDISWVSVHGCGI